MVYLPPAQIIRSKVWVAFADEFAFAGRCAVLYHYWTLQEGCLSLDHLFEPFFCNFAQAGL